MDNANEWAFQLDGNRDYLAGKSILPFVYDNYFSC
jgi:hypothetical protein